MKVKKTRKEKNTLSLKDQQGEFRICEGGEGVLNFIHSSTIDLNLMYIKRNSKSNKTKKQEDQLEY